MAEVEQTLDRQLKSLNRSVLTHGGSVKSTAAEKHVKEQYRIFDEKRRALRHAEGDAQMAELLERERSLTKSRRKKRTNDDH
jgi:hypothetical protein